MSAGCCCSQASCAMASAAKWARYCARVEFGWGRGRCGRLGTGMNMGLLAASRTGFFVRVSTSESRPTRYMSHPRKSPCSAWMRRTISTASFLDVGPHLSSRRRKIVKNCIYFRIARDWDELLEGAIEVGDDCLGDKLVNVVHSFCEVHCEFLLPMIEVLLLFLAILVYIC